MKEEEQKRDSPSSIRLPARGKLAKLVADHLWRDMDGHVLLPVVHQEAETVVLVVQLVGSEFLNPSRYATD